MLQSLQTALAELYEIKAPCNVEDFLLTDAKHLQPLLGSNHHREPREQLLVAKCGDTALVTLYIDESVLHTLETNQNNHCVTRDVLNAYCLAIEGISHFLYTTWRAHHDCNITQLELELQAEIDKYLYLSQMLTGQNSEMLHQLHKIIFDDAELHGNLNAIELHRYGTANRYAAKYCNAFKFEIAATGLQPSRINELRRFYRMTQYEKLRVIDRLN